MLTTFFSQWKVRVPKHIAELFRAHNLGISTVQISELHSVIVQMKTDDVALAHELRESKNEFLKHINEKGDDGNTPLDLVTKHHLVSSFTTLVRKPFIHLVAVVTILGVTTIFGILIVTTST